LTTIAVVDYGMGNRRSVQKALEHAGAHVQVTSDENAIRGADGVVVPGVGAFPLAMRNLRERGLDALLRTCADDQKPLLGICLGMQLLLEHSEELEPTEGLGLIGGSVTPLQAPGLRVPHIGWNEVAFECRSPLTEGLPAGGCAFYHVHSYVARCSDRRYVVATTSYGERFPTIIARDNVFGVQFHPEKSSAHGLLMLERFVALCDCPAEATTAVSPVRA
jgi:imidazole glycerol-phosphate synthase subunit HisH